jgi:hypothetical protein
LVPPGFCSASPTYIHALASIFDCFMILLSAARTPPLHQCELAF